MRKKVVNYLMKVVEKGNPNHSSTELEEIKYGLESMYMFTTKIFVILGLSIVFGYFKEVLYLMFFMLPLRYFASGIHASKSWMCWVASLLSFSIAPIICKYTLLLPIARNVIMIACVILLAIYAPADTHKKPLINKKKRLRNKALSVITGIIYLYLVMTSNNTLIGNIIVVATIMSTVVILPITYRVFKLPYKNYLSYQKNTKYMEGY